MRNKTTTETFIICSSFLCKANCEIIFQASMQPLVAKLASERDLDIE